MNECLVCLFCQHGWGVADATTTATAAAAATEQKRVNRIEPNQVWQVAFWMPAVQPYIIWDNVPLAHSWIQRVKKWYAMDGIVVEENATHSSKTEKFKEMQSVCPSNNGTPKIANFYFLRRWIVIGDLFKKMPPPTVHNIYNHERI